MEEEQEIEVTTVPFHTIPEAKNIAPGKGMTVAVENRRVALFNLDGNYYAIDDTCPHVGAPLGGGWVDGERVACPMHGWEFDIKSGKGLTVPGCSVTKYEVRKENGEIQISID